MKRNFKLNKFDSLPTNILFDFFRSLRFPLLLVLCTLLNFLCQKIFWYLLCKLDKAWELVASVKFQARVYEVLNNNGNGENRMDLTKDLVRQME